MVFDLLYPLDGTKLIGDYRTAIDKGVCKGINFSRHFVAIVNSIYQECYEAECYNRTGRKSQLMPKTAIFIVKL